MHSGISKINDPLEHKAFQIKLKKIRYRGDTKSQVMVSFMDLVKFGYSL